MLPCILRPADHPIRARESISVLRLMPKVRRTAALVAPPSSAAHHRRRKLFAIDRNGAPPPSAAMPSRGKAGRDPLLGQGPLQLRQGTEDMELSRRRRTTPRWNRTRPPRWISAAPLSLCSRSVRLCYKNGPFVSSGLNSR